MQYIRDDCDGVGNSSCSSRNFSDQARKMDGAAEGEKGGTEKMQQGMNYIFLITNNKTQTL